MTAERHIYTLRAAGSPDSSGLLASISEGIREAADAGFGVNRHELAAALRAIYPELSVEEIELCLCDALKGRQDM